VSRKHSNDVLRFQRYLLHHIHLCSTNQQSVFYFDKFCMKILGSKLKFYLFSLKSGNDFNLVVCFHILIDKIILRDNDGRHDKKTKRKRDDIC